MMPDPTIGAERHLQAERAAHARTRAALWAAVAAGLGLAVLLAVAWQSGPVVHHYGRCVSGDTGR